MPQQPRSPRGDRQREARSAGLGLHHFQRWATC
jgi:hypothetical protein